LVAVIIVAFLGFACQQSHQHNHRSDQIQHQQITPLVVPSRPLPLGPPIHLPGLGHLDDAWRNGPCGHWHGADSDEEPCYMV
jgi:hypothetical protein